MDLISARLGRIKHALALSALLAVFVYCARFEIFTWPYYYDEADYMYAASLGWRANYTDHPSQTLIDFVRTGLRNGAAASRRAPLSAEIRARGDVGFYRHWHGPLYSYCLLALAPLGLSEPAMRSLSHVFPMATLFVIYFGALWLDGFLAAFLASALYLCSYATISTNEIAPHQLFVLCHVAALVLLLKWRSTGAPRYWYGAVVACAFAFCTLEVTLVLILVMLVFGRRLLRSALLFCAAILALWPAGLLQLAFVKAYLFMAYLAFLRKDPWGSVGVMETWRLRFTQSPWEWLLLAASAVLCFRFCDSDARRLLLPLYLYAGLMLAALARVTSETPRYMLPFLPALQVAAGFAFASILKRWKPSVQASAAVLICLLTVWNTSTQIRAHPIHSAPRLGAVLACLDAEGRGNQKLLVPQNDLPMIHYYLRGTLLRGYIDEQERSALLAREPFDAVLERDKICAVPTNLVNDDQ